MTEPLEFRRVALRKWDAFSNNELGVMRRAMAIELERNLNSYTAQLEERRLRMLREIEEIMELRVAASQRVPSEASGMLSRDGHSRQ